jgi:thiol-disulfide isomerase/thioredoxin
MKYILLIAATLLTGIALPAQKKIPLELGTDFPYKTNKNLNELLALERKGKGRKIIIDLFGSSCVVCFRMMPKMQEIQDKYRDSVLVVLLGKEDRDIRKVFDKFKSKMSLNFDPVYDSAFFDTYSIPFLPHYIWFKWNTSNNRH